MDCGPTCLRMIAKHYGKSYTLQSLREKSSITREGVSLLGLNDASEKIGFRALGVQISFEQLEEEAPLPCIVHWKQNHFVVVYQIKKNKVFIADPGHGLITYSKNEFLSNWLSASKNGTREGIALLLEPTPAFYDQQEETKPDQTGFVFLASYLRNYKKFLLQLLVGLILGSFLQLVFPFLTQSLVDFGINRQNIGFVYMILIAQLMLFFSRMTVEFIRRWILLHIGSRIQISIISDFLFKLMKLPIAFFDTKLIGDLLQRINDNHRIENFLTSTSLNILFSIVNVIIFGSVILIYSYQIFFVFLTGSALSALWIFFFSNKRRELDYKRFNQLSENQSALYQLIMSMQEIKLNACETQKRWSWEHIQAKLFHINVNSMTINQLQESGTIFINELKNIIITFMAVKSVIDGHITLGTMMAIQYIIGQLNGPIDQMIGFVQSAQDAKLSLERLEEIHNKKDEETADEEKDAILPQAKGLHVSDLSFQYEGPHSPYVLSQLNLEIPEGKVTAIVGASGSGKTTLLKLLLKFYSPTQGEIRLGDISLNNFNAQFWRRKCGVVMQDGYIFSDTIARNVAPADEVINKQRLLHAVSVANIRGYIESLPLAYNTKIGNDGVGLSQGQKQRILIARAVYKDPEYIFFDEATSALDAHNEKIIMENLENFFEGKTVIIIAHRLSTVKNADQIVVLDRGQIIEQGTHYELTDLRGTYFHLVKNQLELGN